MKTDPNPVLVTKTWLENPNIGWQYKRNTDMMGNEIATRRNLELD